MALLGAVSHLFFIRYLWEYFIFSVGFIWSLVYVCMLRQLGVVLAIL